MNTMERTGLRLRMSTLSSLLVMTASAVLAMPANAEPGDPDVTKTAAAHRAATSDAALGFELSNLKTGKCVDHSNRYGLRAIRCNNSDYQLWLVTGNGSNWRLQNAQTGRCLDHSNSHGLRAIRCNGGRWQVWRNLYRSSTNTSAFRNIATNTCLDHSNIWGLHVRNCNGGGWQQWRLS